MEVTMKTKSKRILSLTLALTLLVGTFAGLFSMRSAALDLSKS